MNLIFDILKKLKNSELRIIRNHLNSSPFEYEKVGKLFDLITRYRDKEEDFFSKKLYGESPNNTFRVAKSRLKRLLEDVVLSDKSLTDYSADYINSLLQSRKRLLQGEILLGRGAYLSSKNLLQQVVSTSKKFSLHNEMFQSEFLLSRNQSINMTVNQFQKRSDKLLELNRVNFLVNEAAILHYSLTNLLTSKTITDPRQFEEIDKKVTRIREVMEETDSPLAKYYYWLTIVLYSQYKNDFGSALEACKEYLNLLEAEPSVRSNQRLGSAHFQLSEIALRSVDLEEARHHVNNTMKFFAPDETNYLIVLSSAFRIAFFSQDYTEAHRITEEALAHPRLGASKFREAIWYFFKANLHFKINELRPAMAALNDATALLSDKLGWNLSYRLFEIILLYEMELPDLLDSKILNLRQFVKRTDKNSVLYRPMALIGILMEWHKNSLDLNRARNGINRKLSNLRDHHEKIPFNPSSTELIRLENWIGEKLALGE